MSALCLHVEALSVISSQCADPNLWHQWACSEENCLPCGDTPDFAAIAPGVRRRLSPMGRCALAAYAALNPQVTEPVVWASSWGDISRTFRLTQALTETGEVSPADFALSVHNAIGAQAAIWLKNHCPASAVAAGPVTASCALIEAHLKLHSCDSVVVVRYEEALPALWQETGLPDTSEAACAWAVRLTKESATNTLSLSHGKEVSVPACCILNEVRFLLGAIHSYDETDGQSAWHWEWT